jgi:hypothetical protein
MEKINTENELRAAIVQLETTQAVEGKILKEQFHLTYESVKPINLIKSTLKEASASTEVKDSLLNISVGLAAGYFSKKLFEGVSHEPLRKLLGTALMLGITTAVAKNPVAVKAVGLGLIKIVSSGIQSVATNTKTEKTSSENS